MEIFSTRLKELRSAKGETQLQVASAVGITDRNYRRYEARVVEPTAGVLVSLANHFKVSTDYLLGLSDDDRPTQTFHSSFPVEMDFRLAKFTKGEMPDSDK